MEMAHRIMSLFSRAGIRLSARPQAGTKPAPGGAIETVTVTMSVDEASSLIDTLDGRWGNDDMTVHAHLGLLLGERGVRLGVVQGDLESGYVALVGMDSRDVDALERAFADETGLGRHRSYRRDQWIGSQQ